MRRESKRSVVLTSLLVVVLTASWAAVSAGSDGAEAAIRAATKTWAEAYNAGQVDRIVALYADDAVLMPPNADAASGHAAMKAYLTQDREASKEAGLTMNLVDEGMGVSGDLAWHAGTYTMTDASGETVDRGKWLEAWRKTDGKWLIIRDIWNSDLPAESE